METVNVVLPPHLVIWILVKADRAPPPPLLPPVVMDDDDDNPIHIPAILLHNVAGVPGFPEHSLRSGQVCTANGTGSPSSSSKPGGVMDDPVAFSAGLPGGIWLSDLPDPLSIHEALASPDANTGRAVMDHEMQNLRSHNVYQLVPQHPGMHTLHLGWVLHWKFQNSVFDKHKAWLVARGNLQCPGIDYGKSFSPVMHLESLCMHLSLAALCDFNIIQFDITSMYLHGKLKLKEYMEQPNGYLKPSKEDWVWELFKGLYSLVQAGCT